MPNIRWTIGRRIAVISPKTHTMNEAVAIMTGATEPGAAVSAEKFTAKA